MNAARVEQVEAIVNRVAGETLAYAQAPDGRSFAITREAVQDFETLGSLQKLGIREGVRVKLEVETAAKIVTSLSVYQESGASERDRRWSSGAEESPVIDHLRALDPDYIRESNADQQGYVELAPRAAPVGSVCVNRAIPAEMRQFGKVLDTRYLWPGDLMLTRDSAPDGVSKLITDVQSRGGYAARDARWVHAAMYVGDGLCVVEATFDSVQEGGSVRLTTLDKYCDGNSWLRFRRPLSVQQERDGWPVCVRALSRLTSGYSFADCVRLWVRARMMGQIFSDSSIRQRSSTAVICSALYADSYTEATRRTLGETNGLCVPAWLSMSALLGDVQVAWLAIE